MSVAFPWREPAVGPAPTGLSRGGIPVELFLWAVGLVAFPFYLLDKGSMQLSSALFLMVALAVLARLRRRGLTPLTGETAALPYVLAAFIVYSALISLFWAIRLSDTQLLWAPLYYAFNLIIVFMVLALYRLHGVGLIGFTRWIVFASVVLQFVLSFLFANRGFREMLFFKNANQLGYYALICASILALPLDRERSSTRDALFSLGVLMCVWLALLSLSKAATISTLAFLLLCGMRNRYQLLFGMVVVAVVMSANFSVVETRVDNLGTRLQTFGAEGGDDSFRGRGYDRIWQNPEMLIVGAGEAANYRWYEDGRKTEIHSSIGTIVFSYGIPGTLLMASFFGIIIRTGGWRIVPYMIPEFMFGITHMGLRFTMTWVYFVLLFLVALEWRRGRGQILAISRLRDASLASH